MRLRYLTICCLLAIAPARSVRAGFTFVSLDLISSVTDASQGPLMVDDDRITTATNPLNQTSIAQVGMNIVESTYAFQWNEDAGLGTFNTDLSHAMRSVDVTTLTQIRVFIEPTEPLRVSIDGEVEYAHRPGDETTLKLAMSVRDFETQENVFGEQHEGGNGDLLPSSGVLAIHGETILAPGRLYRLQVVQNNRNFAFPGDTGILDASGYANFSVAPLPEPATALLCSFGVVVCLRRRSYGGRIHWLGNRPGSSSCVCVT